MFTIIVTLLVLIIFGAVLYFNYKKGKTGCNCGCETKKQCNYRNECE